MTSRSPDIELDLGVTAIRFLGLVLTLATVEQITVDDSPFFNWRSRIQGEKFLPFFPALKFFGDSGQASG